MATEQKLIELKEQLPTGFEIVRTDQLNEILSDTKVLVTFIQKLQPLVAPFAGKQVDLMSAIPQIITAIGDGKNFEQEIIAIGPIIEKYK